MAWFVVVLLTRASVLLEAEQRCGERKLEMVRRDPVLGKYCYCLHNQRFIFQQGFLI